MNNQPPNQWISVKDRLPKEYQKVLVMQGDDMFVAVSYGCDFASSVTHWMPLPEPPAPPDRFEVWWKTIPNSYNPPQDEHCRSDLKEVGGQLCYIYSARLIWDAAVASTKETRA